MRQEKFMASGDDGGDARGHHSLIGGAIEDPLPPTIPL
jgi:hypothetical protein